jgi:hypothetical protein
MHALDVHSTIQALGAGGTEANPLMRDLVTRRAAFIGAKAGVTALTIFAAHKVGRRNRAAAIATLVGVNAAYAYVIHQNYQVATGRP